MSQIHDLIHFTVEVFIVHKNKVLLRKHDKLKKWLSVGGHIEPNEDPIEAAFREVKEEVGLNIELDDRLKPSYKKDNTTDLIPPYFLNRNNVNNNHKHVTFVYFAKTNTYKVKQGMRDEQSEECRWFTKEEIEQNTEIMLSIKYYALKALKILSR